MKPFYFTANTVIHAENLEEACLDIAAHFLEVADVDHGEFDYRRPLLLPMDHIGSMELTTDEPTGENNDAEVGFVPTQQDKTHE